jgi:hypothetical protein
MPTAPTGPAYLIVQTMRRIPWPAITLMFVAPFIGEVMSTATSLFEFGVPFVSVFDAVLYGGGALLVREATRRWALGLPGLLALGAAYGIYEEAGLTRTWFATSYQPEMAEYSRIWGTNLLQAVHLTTFHAAASIGCSIAVVELLFPRRRQTAWIGRGGIWLVAATQILLLPLTLADAEGFFAPCWPQMTAALTIALALVVSARFLPRWWPEPSRARGSARPLALWAGAATTAHFVVVYACPYLKVPWPVAVAVALAIPVVAVIGAPRFLPASRDQQMLGVVIGVVGPLAVLNVALLRPDTLLAAAIAVAGLIFLAKRTGRGHETEFPVASERS